MTERATVFEKPQICVEATSGTSPTTGYKQLQSWSLEPGIKTNVDLFRAQGYKFATVAAQGKEWTEFKAGGQPCYTEIIYPLSSVLNSATPSVIGAGYRWVFYPTTSSLDTPKTYTIEGGTDGVRAGACTYCIMPSFGLNWTREKLDQSGSLLAQRYKDDKRRWLQLTGSPAGGTFTITVDAQTTAGIAYNASTATVLAALEALSNVAPGDFTIAGAGALPTNVHLITATSTGAFADVDFVMSASGASLTGGTSPAANVTRMQPAATTIALTPVLPREVSFYFATAQSGLAGASAMTRVLSCSWDISDRYGPIWALDASQESWAATVEKAPKSTFKFKLAADSNGMQFLSKLRRGSTCFFSVKAVGDALDATYYNTLELQHSTKITDISDYTDEDGLFAVEYTGEACHDATWGKALEVAVQNTIASL